MFVAQHRAYDSWLLPGVFDALLKCARLKSLVVRFGPWLTAWLGMVHGEKQLDAEVAAARQQLFSGVPATLERFQGLTRLTLLEIWGDIEEWKNCLVQCLVQNPGLQHLALSLHFQTRDLADVRGDASQPVPERRSFQFLCSICEQFAQLTTTRLRLRSLRVDSNIGFPEVAVLSRLTEVFFLEDIHSFAMNCHGSGEWPVDADAMYPSNTPLLKQLSFSHMVSQTWSHMDLILDRDGLGIRRDLAMRSNNWDYPKTKLYHHGSQQRLFHGYEKAPTCRLLVKSGWPLMRRGELPAFQYGDRINQLGLTVSYALWDALYQREKTESLSNILLKLPNLQALWLVPEDAIWLQKPRPQGEEKPKESHVLEAARACQRLRYVRIAYESWRIRVDGSSRVLERLDAWEDEAECPDIFYSPPPLAWSDFVKHSEGRE
ncbi:hypothetical protein PWT90_10516 [Aphanocladium album]|nr:hypothetical protein PWT90_10516 [Aphanocladium album]